ncbi:MAG: SPOR domain-containing protein [Rhizobiaceae bacterium]|nr:SPOR domain-containing protein [Rhizobiaceae bacterium]
MADNNHLNRDNSADVADDDPFAELARIMNQGAHGKTQPAAEETVTENPAGDPLAVDLERELLGELDEGFDQPDDLYDDEPSEAAQEAPPADAEPVYADADADGPEPIDEGSAEPLPGYSAEQPEFEPDDADEWDAAEPVFDDGNWNAADSADNWQAAPEAVPEETYHDAAVLADVDMDFGDLDAAAPVASDAAVQDGPEAETAPAQGDVTLEDELEMLLTGGPSAGGNDVADHADAEADPWQDLDTSGAPQSTIFGRANFSGADHRYDEAGNGDGDGIDGDEAGFDARADEPAADEPQTDPFAALATLGAQVSADAEKAAPPPDFETVEVPETALMQHDDLDLPDLPEDVPPLPEDDFEAHFGADFADELPARTEPAAASLAYREEPAVGEDDDFYAQALGFGAAHQPEGDFAARTSPQPDEDDDADIAAATVGAAALSRHGKPQTSRRGGFMVASVVLGVALLGGIGAFALSVGGDDSGTPVLVRADDEPMKVKPEDPGGGAAVPNQDSVAYEAASGGGSGDTPRQETLVSTTEEPVNIASRTIETDRLPGVDDGPIAADDGASGKAEDRLAAAGTDTQSDVSDDVIAVQPRRVRTMIVRPDGTLVPREEEEPAAAAQPEPQPETMVAEEPAAALPAAQPAETAASETAETQQPVALPATETAATAEEPQTVVATAEPEPAAPQPQETAAVEPADPVTPRVGPVAPSRPATQTSSQPQQVAQAAPAPARTQAAAPAPAATASSEWSMQIASQPSAESAQATYQDLARRYGDLLGGRGVNIVRAEIEGKGTYYRVRIPTSSRNDGIALCERYKAAGGSCFVSK